MRAMTGSTRLVLIGAALLAAAASAATQDKPEQRPTFRGGANVVRVDVTVTSRRGEPVTDLTRDDFEVTEDGTPQTIDSFQLVRATGETTDDRSLPIRSSSHATAEAARDDVRLFLIFWDEYHIGQFIPALRAREALKDFVLTAFGPTDLVGIMDQLTTVDSIKFTRERRELANQVHTLKGRLGVLVPARSAVEEEHMRAGIDIGRLRNEVTMSALMAAAAFLGNLREGRKSLLFVSQGIPMYGRSGESDRYREIVATANRNNTAIYTLDPASGVGRRPDSLLALADDTGGRAFVGTNQPALQLPQIVRDSSAYYLLGYTSPAPVDGKFHKINVRLKKGGYDVRARSGYFAPTLREMVRGRAEAAAAEAVPDDVERALGELTAAVRPDQAVDLWVGMSRGDAGNTRVTLAWAPRRSTAAADDLGLEIAATGPEGASYFRTERTTGRVITFDAPPGDLVLATTVRNARGEDVQGDVRRLKVPAFGDSTLAIGSPAVLRARTPRDQRAIAAGGALAPDPGRTFDRTDRLFVRFPLYGGAGATATARLVNRQGAELRALPVASLGDGVHQVDVPLSLTPRGDYLIAIEAAGAGGSTRAVVAFRVR